MKTIAYECGKEFAQDNITVLSRLSYIGQLVSVSEISINWVRIVFEKI